MERSVNCILLIVSLLVGMLFFITPHATAGIYQFDNGSLQGWTMQGIYAYSTYPTAYSPNPFNISWDDATQYPGSISEGAHNDPIGNNLGSLSASTSNITLPPGFPSGELWFIDLISPDVTSDSQWQNMTGLSLKLRGDAGQGWAQLLLDVTRKSNGEQLNIMEVNHAGYGVFHDITTDNLTNPLSSPFHWMNLTPHFGDLSAYTINKVRARIFGSHDNIAEKINIDNVAPTSGIPAVSAEGKVMAGSSGEYLNYIIITYDSDLGPSPQLTHAVIDFTGTNVKVEYIAISLPYKQITSATKVNNQIVEIQFAGFDPGEKALLLLELNRMSTGDGTPVGSDYAGGTVELTFAGLPGTCQNPLTGTFSGRDFLTGEAIFSCPYEGVDADDDGYTEEVDCNDDDNTVYPGAPELCDGKDNDCDGTVDEGVTSTFYRDSDGDGYGNADDSIQTCSAPSGYVADNTDCDDTNPLIQDCNTPVSEDPISITDDTGDVEVIFPNVTVPGNTAITSGVCENPPEGINLTQIDPLCVDVETGASYEGLVEICIHYNDTGMTYNEERYLRMVRCDADGICELLQPCEPDYWPDTANNIVCACTDHFSQFAIGTPLDTDGDSIPDLMDNCPYDINWFQEDIDGDGIGDICDNCPSVWDPTNHCAACVWDFNQDQDVDGLDWALFVAGYGTSYTSTDLADIAEEFGRVNCF